MKHFRAKQVLYQRVGAGIGIRDEENWSIEKYLDVLEAF